MVKVKHKTHKIQAAHGTSVTSNSLSGLDTAQYSILNHTARGKGLLPISFQAPDFISICHSLWSQRYLPLDNLFNISLSYFLIQSRNDSVFHVDVRNKSALFKKYEEECWVQN